MSIESVTQGAASSYIAQQTGTNPSAQTGEGKANGTGDSVTPVQPTNEQRTHATGRGYNLLGPIDISMLQEMTGEGKALFSQENVVMIDATIPAKILEATYRRAKDEFDTEMLYKHMDVTTSLSEKLKNEIRAITGARGDFGIEVTSSGISILNPAGARSPLPEKTVALLRDTHTAINQAINVQRPQFMSFEKWKLENVEET